ncbi:MAG TPA: hypothetical protein PLT17_03615, partial [Chitinophagales bacterium]|nr:hypothetical protein [Chitinophagales bacterium]
NKFIQDDVSFREIQLITVFNYYTFQNISSLLKVNISNWETIQYFRDANIYYNKKNLYYLVNIDRK